MFQDFGKSGLEFHDHKFVNEKIYEVPWKG